MCVIGAAAFAVACTDDDAAKPGGGDGGSVDGGGTGTDGGGTGNDGGGPVDGGGFLPDTGTPDAGECPASQPLFSSGFQASCVTCLGSKCCAQVKACESVPDCLAFAQCYAGCFADGGTQGPCTSQCIAGKDAGAVQTPFNQLVLCGGNNCNNDGGASAPKCPF